MKKHLERLKPYPLPGYPRKDKIRLDLNENSFGPAPGVLDVLKNATPEDIAVYPDYRRIEEEIAKYVGVKKEYVVVTNGADDAIKCVFEGIVDHGDRVLIPNPTYSMYEIYTDLYDGKKIFVNYDKDFAFPIDEFIEKVRNVDLAVVVNPANPTGDKILRKDFLKIMEATDGTPVILDETYWQFGGETFASLVEKFQNLFVIHSFSKLFSMAGVRLGYVITRNRELIEKVIEPFRVSSLAVKLGIATLQNIDYYRGLLEKIARNREYLVVEFNNRGLEARNTFTNFILVNAGNRAKFIKTRLFDRGILIKSYEEPNLLRGFLRVSVGKFTEIEELFRNLDDILPDRVLIFDLDGVLVDVRESYRTAIKKTAEFFIGDEVSYEKIQEFKNRGGLNNDWDLTHEIVKSHGVDVSRDEIIKKFQELFLGENFDGFISREKWILKKEILEELFKRYRLAIFTSRPREEAIYTLKKYGVEKFFDMVISLDDVKETKPSPEGILKILKSLKIKPENAVYFGDTVDDMMAANSAGVLGVGIAPPGGELSFYEKLFKKYGAKDALKSINEIMDFLKKWENQTLETQK